MNDLTERSLETFLDAVAKRAPTPGGGSVTAAAGALAGSLARMAVAYSVGTKTPDDTRVHVERAAAKLLRVDQLLRALITQDATAYAAMTTTATAVKAAPDDASAQTAHEEAAMRAIAVPMETAALASQALSVMYDVKDITNPNLLSDLGVAGILAEATARAARYMVLVNAPEVRDANVREKILTDIDAVVEHCAEHAASIEAHVNTHLQNRLAACR